MRKYLVSLAPCLMPNGERTYEVLSEGEIHEILGEKMRYYASPDQGFFHIEDLSGNVLFACPAHLVVWCKVIPENCPVLTLIPKEQEDGEESKDRTFDAEVKEVACFIEALSRKREESEGEEGTEEEEATL